MPEPQSQSKKISLNLKEFAPPLPPVTPVVPQPVQKPAQKPTPKPEPVKTEKKLVRKSPVVAHKSEETNITKAAVGSVTPNKREKKPKKVVKKVKPKKVKKKPIKRVVKRKVKRYRDPLANALMGSSKPVSSPSMNSSYDQKFIKRLYGKEFYTYSKEQKAFIKQKLGDIYRITQNTLWRRGYPDAALRMEMQGTNIVSFYLHPNGSISNLHLKTPIGYRALDNNTIELIKTAYKDYPRPQKKTKIIFYVTYKIY